MIEFTIPMTKDLIVSEANRSNENRFIKKKRHDTQKFLINSYMNNRVGLKCVLPCFVKMVRIAPRELDEEENLRMSFKYIKDYIADFLIPGLARGRADGDKRIKWDYGQEKGKPKQYSIRIEILPYIVYQNKTILLEKNESPDASGFYYSENVKPSNT